MKKLNTSIFVLGIVSLTIGLANCDRHEVIPAPLPVVEYDCSFSGIANDTTNILLSDGIDGYKCLSSSTKVIDNGAGNSSAVFDMEIFSEVAGEAEAATIKHGTVEWNTSGNTPDLETFENEYNETTYPFSANGDNGVEITYIDNSGNEWISDTLYNNYAISDSANSFEYTKITQESDTLDYLLFEASFNCVFFRVNTTNDTLRMQIKDGRFKGRYTRK